MMNSFNFTLSWKHFVFSPFIAMLSGKFYYCHHILQMQKRRHREGKLESCPKSHRSKSYGAETQTHSLVPDTLTTMLFRLTCCTPYFFLGFLMRSEEEPLSPSSVSDQITCLALDGDHLILAAQCPHSVMPFSF